MFKSRDGMGEWAGKENVCKSGLCNVWARITTWANVIYIACILLEMSHHLLSSMAFFRTEKTETCESESGVANNTKISHIHLGVKHKSEMVLNVGILFYFFSFSSHTQHSKCLLLTQDRKHVCVFAYLNTYYVIEKWNKVINLQQRENRGEISVREIIICFQEKGSR